MRTLRYRHLFVRFVCVLLFWFDLFVFAPGCDYVVLPTDLPRNLPADTFPVPVVYLFVVRCRTFSSPCSDAVLRSAIPLFIVPALIAVTPLLFPAHSCAAVSSWAFVAFFCSSLRLPPRVAAVRFTVVRCVTCRYLFRSAGTVCVADFLPLI